MLTKRGKAGESCRFVIPWHRAALVGTFGLFTVLLLSLAVSSDNVAVLIWVLVWLPLMVLLTVRSARATSIEFEADLVVIHGLFRTRRLAWNQVHDVGVTRGTSAALLPWRVPYFELNDGSSVLADEIRSLREPSIVDDVIAEARRRLDQLK